MKKFLYILSLAVIVCSCCSKVGPLSTSETVSSKNWPFVWALSQSQDAINLLAGDAVLSDIGAGKLAACSLSDEIAAIEGFKWTDGQIDSAAERLARAGGPVTEIACRMRESGKYYIYNELSDSAFIASAFRQDAEGMNYCLEVFAQGVNPYYGGNDAGNFDVSSFGFSSIAENIRTVLLLEGSQSFFTLPMKAAAAWLEANDRGEAADCEPLARSNAAAFKAAKKVKWNNYPYSLILVPGKGQDFKDQSLSAEGRQRARYAADLYLQGVAPFLVVSGSRVHPKFTPYIEAVEMHRYLTEELGIPEGAVIIEPHARHTTTNIRNTVRLMMAGGFPMDKPALIASSRYQLDYIETDEFVNLCEYRMQAMPYRKGKRLNERQLEFWPLAAAAQVSPVDPMDP